MDSPAIPTMSLNSHLIYYSQQKERSCSLTRKLRLLELVIPVFPVAASQAYDASQRYTPERRFWTNFITPCMLIDNAGCRFGKLDDSHGLLVDQLLLGLEMSITKVDDFAKVCFCRRSCKLLNI